MRRTLARITLTAAATAGLAATSWVQALGLGEINVDSNLNQRFVASIPLTEINAEELETVTVSVAPNEAFDRAGIERTDYLSSLDFEIKNDRGRPRVIVTSSQIAREPVLNLLVQARWSGGKILRDYTILLDPPEVATRPVASAPAPVIAVAPARPAPVTAAPKPLPAPTVPAGAEFYEPAPAAKPVSKPAKPPAASNPAAAPAAAFDSAFDSATSSYGPVAAKETLWSIATKVRPGPAVSMDQVLLALSEANPAAIQRGTTVNKGATLRVPSAERIQATSAADAKLRLAALRSGGKPAAAAVKPSAAASKPASPKPASTAPTTAPVVAAPVTAAPVIAAPKPAVAAPAPPKPAAPVVAAEKPPVPAAAPEVKRPELPKPQLALPPKAEVAATASPAAAPASTPVPAPEPKPAAAPATPVTAASSATAAPAPAVAETAAASAATPASTEAPATEAAPVAAVSTTAAAPAEAAATPPPAEPSPAPVPVKAPLAQPLPAESEESLLSSFGLPLGLLALALLGGLYWLSKRSKKNKAAAGFSQFKPGDTASVTPPVAGSGGAAGKLGDTTRLSGTQSLGPKAVGAALAAEATQQLLTQQLDQITTQTGSPAAASHDSTLVLDPDVAATLNSSVKHSAVTGGEASFDKTTQVHVDTLHISLDDNDPLAEADFHLAYGLYDEAILLLMTATRQQPERIELKVKLAETYFAAGRPLEFQEIAEELHSQLPPAEWSKIAIMGAQICPDVALFHSAGDSGMAADFDLAFDEPESAPQPAPVAASNSIDFSLSAPTALPGVGQPLMLDDDLDAPSNSKPATPAPSSFDDEASIDFMLGQSLTPLGAGMKVPEPSSMSFNLGSPTLNIEPPHFSTLPPAAAKNELKHELLKDDLLEISELSDSPTIAPPAGDMLAFSLQDLEVSITPRNITGGSKEDEFNTKLDLARAYVEMGDNDMARGLLLEVQSQGGERQQQEANTLLQRLPA